MCNHVLGGHPYFPHGKRHFWRVIHGHTQTYLRSIFSTLLARGRERCGLWLPVYCKKCKGSPYLITERRVPELLPLLGSQPAGDVSHNKLGDGSFSAAGPRLSNDLPPGLRRPGLTFDSFRQSLKTHLFGDRSA